MLVVFLVVAFLVVPIAEIYLIIQVGQAIGAWQTVVLLLVESWLGSLLVRREGRRAWRALRESAGAGRLPSRELADSALVLVGGTLLLTPGFLTDVVAFFLLFPASRPLARRLLLRWITRQAVRAAAGHQRGSRRRTGAPGSGPPGTTPWPRGSFPPVFDDDAGFGDNRGSNGGRGSHGGTGDGGTGDGGTGDGGAVIEGEIVDPPDGERR